MHQNLEIGVALFYHATPQVTNESTCSGINEIKTRIKRFISCQQSSVPSVSLIVFVVYI